MPPTETDRVVCLGDSITDGYTYGQILMQALREAGKPTPAVICAGVAGDTAPQMAARLERTVLIFEPAVVTFLAGTNDALRSVTAAQYESALREIAAKVKTKGARMVLCTPCLIQSVRGKTKAEQDVAAKAVNERLNAFEAVIRKIAAENGWPVAENRALMQRAVDAGETIMAADGIHPDYHGQSLIARSILDALGGKDIPLPKSFDPKLFPGVVREWRMRPAPLDAKKKPERLTAESEASLQPDGTWKTYTLPDPVPAKPAGSEDWREQERRNGFGTRIRDFVGPAALVQAVAWVESDADKPAFINTAIGVSSCWLNGKKIHEQGEGWTGYHAGKERLAVTLVKGRNRLVVEIAGGEFFLSVTDKLVWEEELRK